MPPVDAVAPPVDAVAPPVDAVDPPVDAAPPLEEAPPVPALATQREHSYSTVPDGEARRQVDFVQVPGWS
ncbi:MAG: hypothetical protein FJ104_17730 [Deltaproteobacteria bacterium]|nr:hypothetical protein [Deltaproteobacteria bacterium]